MHINIRWKKDVRIHILLVSSSSIYQISGLTAKRSVTLVKIVSNHQVNHVPSSIFQRPLYK